MLTSVEFENYRGFERLKVEGLSRVNLITGFNNSGKTALLEGLHFLASGGDVAVLKGIAVRRGEVAISNADNAAIRPTAAHFFFGHQCSINSRFVVRASNKVPTVEVSALFADDLQLQKRFLREFGGDANGLYLAVDQIREARIRLLETPLASNGDFLPELSFARPRESVETAPVRFLAADSLSSSTMREMWDRVLMNGTEDRVNEALRVVDSDIEDVVFLQGAAPPRRNSQSGVLIRSKTSSTRIPLGSLGDGMRRLLALGLCLSEAAGGMLLIDEVDTGLHWSVMPDMWKLVIETAIRTDTQVFVTTHSLDCIRALARLCEDNPQYSEHISAQKLHRSLDHSVSLDARNLMIAVEQDIEVR